ncbi:MAG: hypothetical protein AAFU03_04830, partial [Bacteroidota bacterium]
MRNGQVLDFAERSLATRITPTPIKPWATAEQWRPLMEENDFAAVAAQALYGESFDPTTSEPDASQPSSLINTATEQQNRFGFALFSADHSYEVAQAMGLAFIDEGLNPSEQYLYRVYPDTSAGFSIDTGFVHVDPAQEYPLPKILGLQADFENKRVTVSWNKDLFASFYVSYQIERSTDGVTWTTVNDAPFINTDRGPRGEEFAYIVDTLANNNIPHFYRVMGRTPFDEFGPPSDPVQGMGIDPLPTFFPEIDGIYETEEGALNVQWVFDRNRESDITGFYLQRADNDKGPYTVISELIPPDQRFFIDASPLPTNYYKVIGVDTYGREMPSFSALAQTMDSIPPAPPLNVRGKIMEDGTMVITWDKNTEPDFYGNRVFISNNPYMEFSQITVEPATRGYHIDSVTLNTLTENVYVKVTSLDYRHNTSKFSEMAIVTRPDTIAPAAAVFTGFEAGTEWIALEWANSQSTDITATELLRRSPGDADWELLQRFSFPEEANVTSHNDVTIKSNQRYEYMLRVVDDAELTTDSKIIEVRALRNMVADSIGRVAISADRRAKVVILNWNYENAGELEYFRIYRAIEDGSPVTYATISKAEAVLRERKKGNKTTRFQYVDEEVKMNTAYRYQVKAVFGEGVQSPKSRLVEVAY